MAHFAEINSNNIVLRVVVACNQDIANNGGELSEQAAKHFETVCPLSYNGVKWVQTSYNNNFRKQFAGTEMYYDSNKDKFINKQPYPSWTLNNNDDWQPPVSLPTPLTYPQGAPFASFWDENGQKWFLKDGENTIYFYNYTSNAWEKA
jgi:hypothetical protein